MITYEQYYRMPDDGKRYEVIEGRLYERRTPWLRHQKVSGRLLRRLSHLEVEGWGEVFIGPLDVVLDEHNVFQPDLLIVKPQNRRVITKRAIEGPPDVAIEVLSHWNREHDTVLKAGIYARLGVPQLWIVDPDENRIEIHRNEGTMYRLEMALVPPALLQNADFPALSIDLTALFDPEL